MSASGTVVSVNVSTEKGTKKVPALAIRLLVDHGIEGDAHAGAWHRQVSLLAQESIDTMIARAPSLALSPGDFAENVTTRGLHLWSLPVGARLAIGAEVLLEVTQIGKECHHGCEIRRQVGDCVMPREGIFTRVVRGGVVRSGDPISVVPEQGD